MRARGREQGRGERVLPGLWRLRLPLPWPGVPHGNAWAIADGEGIVLVDTGVHEEGSLAELERAMDQVGLRLEQVHRLVITHATPSASSTDTVSHRCVIAMARLLGFGRLVHRSCIR